MTRHVTVRRGPAVKEPSALLRSAEGAEDVVDFPDDEAVPDLAETHDQDYEELLRLAESNLR